ncbi:late control protein D [Clostridium botulinum]|nr:late control protein D [Clostridium botulinum]
MNDAITYKELKISTFELLYIKDLKINAGINEHSTLNLVGILPQEKEDKDINTKCNTPIEVYTLEGEEKKPLYFGIITEIKIKRVAEYFELHVKAESYTYLMDITRRTRSFQNKDLSIYDFIQNITNKYIHGSCNMNIPYETTNRLWLQYNETDWEFVKRIASYYNVGLFAHSTLEGVHYYLGTPDEYPKSIEAYEYTVTKLIKEYEKIKENDLPDSDENQYINYNVKSHDILDLGACVNFKGHFFYVSKLTYEIEDGILETTYDLQTSQGQNQCRIYNEKLQGISLEGTVIEVSSDEIKVKLDIDGKNENSDYCWFKYSTIAASPDGSGWYFMPEINDRARVYFPTHDENEAFAISCIHKINADPSVKYITTINGKKIIFSEDSITISANDSATITLSSGGGISISGGSISLNASENISIRAEDSVVVSGKDNVELSCDKGGKVTLDNGGNVVLNGTKVKIN